MNVCRNPSDPYTFNKQSTVLRILAFGDGNIACFRNDREKYIDVPGFLVSEIPFIFPTKKVGESGIETKPIPKEFEKFVEQDVRRQMHDIGDFVVYIRTL